ncbi:MAG: hypothetical protein ACM3JB_12850 [Acidobacteriaceae bacterium]
MQSATKATPRPEPAQDDIKGNLNPIGRVFYSAAMMICTPAGEKRIREVVMAGGFTQFRRAAETPFNIVYEARP